MVEQGGVLHGERPVRGEVKSFEGGSLGIRIDDKLDVRGAIVHLHDPDERAGGCILLDRETGSEQDGGFVNDDKDQLGIRAVVVGDLDAQAEFISNFEAGQRGLIGHHQLAGIGIVRVGLDREDTVIVAAGDSEGQRQSHFVRLG